MSIVQNRNNLTDQKLRPLAGPRPAATSQGSSADGVGHLLDRRRLFLSGAVIAAGGLALTSVRGTPAAAEETKDLRYEYPQLGLIVTLVEPSYGDRAHAIHTEATVTSTLDHAVSIAWEATGAQERATYEIAPGGSAEQLLLFTEWDSFATVHELTLYSSGTGDATTVDTFALTWDEIFDAHLPSRGGATLADVSTAHANYDDIVWALDRGLDYGSVGIRDRSFFYPDDVTTKGDVAMFLHHLRHPRIKPAPFEDPFADIEPADEILQSAIDVHDRGIMWVNTGGDQRLYFEGDGQWVRARVPSQQYVDQGPAVRGRSSPG
ncbi:hypothetical protein GWK18_05005 [Kocuria sp. JC486]|uniref:S-layer homology domain-containing protein n=1 Tax=Kocuria soli TaxID=2485125 RepID=A0A3N3ZQC1_9MICC|nr:MULTISPECIES: hypothetical protein [Kocuria]NHU84957.1 hypothetical protein [Kocuria sp. JC486]ROZ63323.1 hypothetical protein EDL96_07235 [Kocuria soli]